MQDRRAKHVAHAEELQARMDKAGQAAQSATGRHETQQQQGPQDETHDKG